MGIKGIYKEIGTGERISLTKLAVQKLEESGRPLRIAIDISIWQFQVQAARGGSNPAIRTLFYRLLRLLSLAIQPIFVFDGPNKPAFKRNKRSGRGDGVATAMAKRLIRLFGFLVHDAPGEAEAECALLQQNGIVDAVLSEDVDTIMFGCTRTLRNWTSEGTKGSKTPTHVSMYDTRQLSQGPSGLDREGMVLVALMSGGDYLPEGIPGAGVKLACEAARAGFGKSLCQIKRANTSELASWREWLTFELRHNESGFFRTRHKALTIPDDFPNMEILRYYTHPVVSPATTLDKLRQHTWDREIDVQGLREFVRETFDWSYRIGAIKYIRVLAPCLLVRKLMQHIAEEVDASTGTNADGKELVRSITNQRAHFSTDATPELRVSFIPTSIVGYDFQEEPDEVIEFGRDGLALNSDDDIEGLAEELGDASSTAKPGARKPFSPTEADLAWVPEAIVRAGIPSMVAEWEEARNAKTMARSKPKASRAKAKTAGMATGSLNKFGRVTKHNVPQTTVAKQTSRPPPGPGSPPAARVRTPLDVYSPSSETSPQKIELARPSKPPTLKPSKPGRKPPRVPVPKADASTNPWTIASSQGSPRATKPKPSSTKASGPILIPSSPPSSPPEDIRHSVSHAGDSDYYHEPDPFTTPGTIPRERRSATPLRPTTDEADDPGSSAVRGQISTPAPAAKSQRKLARAESMPIDPSPHHPRGRTAGFSRAQTVAEIILLDSEDEDEDSLELPPLSSLVSRLPGGKSTVQTPLPSEREIPGAAAGRQGRQQKAGHEQTAPDEPPPPPPAAARMTKLYVPREGFFEEIDVRADEADALREAYAACGPRTAAWRRSDVFCVDLTGEE
ncbi:hypothetical protein F4802DRAFT_329805 [Xylaria palmicola]|nr:hypothetical protein F4802DRAFT_329805 [Xylaria palmicola]